MSSLIDQFLRSLVLPDEPRYNATNYMDTPYALRSQRINLPSKSLNSTKLRKYQLITTPPLSSCGIYVHLPTRLIIVNCEDNGSFVIRKNQYELQDVILRADINRGVPPTYDDTDVGASSMIADEENDESNGDDDDDNDLFNADSLLKELKCLEEDYNITIPTELNFSRHIKYNDAHLYVDLDGNVLHFMKPVPLLPIYIGIFDPKTQTIQALNYNDKYYRADMVHNKRNLVFYQKFYTSIKIYDVIVIPMRNATTLLPTLEVLIDHLLSVESTLRSQNEYLKAEKDDIVTKIMHFYQQVYPNTASPIKLSTAPTPIGARQRNKKAKLKRISLPTASPEKIKSIVLFKHDLNMRKFSPSMTVSDSSISAAMTLFNQNFANATTSESDNDNDEDDQGMMIHSNAARVIPLAETPITVRSRGVPNTVIGFSRKRLRVAPTNRKAISENATPLNGSVVLSWVPETLPRRMEIRNIINPSSDNEDSKDRILEVEQSLILSSSSPHSEKGQKTHNEVINSTNSTDQDRTKASPEDHRSGESDLGKIDSGEETQLEDQPSEETQNLVTKFMRKSGKVIKDKKYKKNLPSITFQPRNLRSKGSY